MIDENHKGEVSTHIISWLATDKDLRDLFEDIIITLKPKFDEYNKQVMDKYNLSNDALTKVRNLYLTIFRKYTIPVYGTISSIINSNKLFFKSKDDWKALLKEIADFSKQNANQLIPLFRLSDLHLKVLIYIFI